MTRRSVRSIFLLTVLLPSTLGTFEDEPQSSGGIVPFGQQAVFYCKASQGFLFSTWDVKILNRDLGTNVGFESDALRGFGIISNISNDMSESYLIVNATEATNNISIVCELRDDSAMQFKSSIIRTAFYGPPSAPTNLIISNYSNGQLHVVWDFSSTPGVDTMFSLTVVKNNSYSRQQSTITYPSLVNTTTQINVTFSFCDVLYLWVRASNNAGESERSPVAMWIPPYQPSFSPLSLKPSLSKTDDGVFVTVAIQVPQICPEYSQAFFDVVLENITGKERKWRQKAVQETREQLAEDQVYLLHVQSNGEPLTSQQKIVTSDVQGVEVCTEDKALNIRCLFITGSTVDECGYTLVGASNITGHIIRTSVQGSRVDVNDISNYNKIIVYEASSQPDFSDRGTFVTESLQNLTDCPSSGTPSNGGVTSHSNRNRNQSPSLPLLVIILPVAVVAATIIFIVIFLTILNYCCRKCYSGRTNKSQSEIPGINANGKYKGQSRCYAQNAQVADKDHEDDYDMLDTVSRGSLGTRGSLTRTSLSRGSISARGADTMVRGGTARKSALTEDFGAPEDGDYAQLNTEPVYQVLESDRATVTPATTPHHPTATPTGGYRDTVVTTTTNRHSSGTVPNSNSDIYAQLNQEPVYQVLENDGSHGYRNSRRTSFSRTSLTPPSLQPDLPAPHHNPPSLPTRSRTVTDPNRIKYSDVQV